jgi:KDO2-lipid IV(A) lauroyltransferase
LIGDMAQAADPTQPLTFFERAARVLLAALARLPLGVFRALGWFLGHALFAFAAKRRQIALVNLRLCFPHQTEPWRRQLVRRHMVVFAQCLFDRVWLWHAPVPVLAKRFVVCGDVSRLANRVPRVIFAPHFEGMDAGGLWMSHLTQRQWYFMYSVQLHAGMERWVFDGRSRFNVKPVPRDDGIKPLLRGLKAGEILHFSPDMDLGRRDAVFVPFFAHHDTATVTSMSRLASLAQAPVCGLVTQLTPRGYRVTLTPDWEGYPSGDDVADARMMNSQLEAWILQHPEQYHWTHRRFKSRPDGYASVYDA